MKKYKIEIKSNFNSKYQGELLEELIKLAMESLKIYFTSNNKRNKLEYVISNTIKK